MSKEYLLQKYRIEEKQIINFFKNVEKTKTCWNCQKIPNSGGYAIFHANYRAFMASRIIWELYNGPIPDKLYVCHKCDNRICVNPEHLFLGTQKENIQDAINKGKIKIKLTESNKEEIKLLAKLGMSQRAIGKKFNVSCVLVCRILNK